MQTETNFHYHDSVPAQRSICMEPYGIALVGCGTVGSGVAKLLLEYPERLAACAGVKLEHPERLAARAGRKLELRHIIVRDLNKPRDPGIPRRLFATNLAAAIADPAVQAVVEVVGGIDWARQAVLDMLAAGKHIVTANK